MIDIYNDPELYDALHKDIDNDKEIISHYARQCNGPVLELASGTGRLAKYIIDLGLPYTGIDNSEPFLDKANNNFANKGSFLLHDMRDFNLKQSYDFIFIGFNSFLHNLTDEDAKNCLHSVKSHLSKNGLFLLSIFLPDPIFLYREEYLFEAKTYFDYKGKKCRVMEKNVFDEENQINSLTWYLESDGVLSDKPYFFQQRMYYPHMMDILFEQSGLKVLEKFGDWDRSVLEETSPLQIYICSTDN
jgi:SAM-dependent methyltransferase